jgi:hypothetical protein
MVMGAKIGLDPDDSRSIMEGALDHRSAKVVEETDDLHVSNNERHRWM